MSSSFTNTATQTLPSYTHREKQHLRSRKYFETRRRIFDECASTIISCSIVENDNRPYVKLNIANKTFTGLMDSGANVSILGRNSLEFIKQGNHPYHRIQSCIRTADGTKNEVHGYVSFEITYNGITDTLRFFIVPSLIGELYLGIDFWHKFRVVPYCVNEIISVEPNEDSNKHFLTVTQRHELDSVIANFPSFEKKGLGRTHLIEHKIDTGDSPPVKQRHYPISPAVQDAMYLELDRMLKMDVIEECDHSPWSSPVVLVKKSNGKVRLCLDSRKVNQATKKDAYPLPLIDGLLGRLNETKFISSLDLKDAFWQIPLALESRDKTAFVVPGRPLYRYKVTAFGLCNAPQTMCRLMDKVIPYRLHGKIFVYLDDLLIISATYDELTINVEKSHFLLREIKYLGYLVGEKGLRADPTKVDAIVDFPQPVSVKQTRRLLGMAGWYRRFIPNFASLTSPLTDLLKKCRKFQWTAEAELAFTELKKCLTTAPILINPDYTRPFFIRCDASTQGVGGVLYQKSNEGDEFPISFMSQKLNGAQRNYNVTELECLAAVLSVKKFRPYIEGHDFTIITDHSSLKWLMSQRDLNGRLARWSMKLAAFRFKIEHVKGADNVVPDTLSRIYCDTIDEFESCYEISAMNSYDFSSVHFEEDEYKAFRAKIESNPDDYPLQRVKDGRIFIRLEPKMFEPLSDMSIWKLWVPKGLVNELIAHDHNDPLASHGGIKKTLCRLRRFYFWPKMVVDVKNYVALCSV